MISIPKTLGGLALLGLAAVCNAVPFLSVLTPYLASAGIGAITIGIGAKVNRAIKKQDIWQNEKDFANKLKPKGK